jgi:hypothetical protein
VPVGYVDVAGQPVLGEPILAVGVGGGSAPELLKAGRDIAVERHGLSADAEARLVAYSFPKLAVQILEDEREQIMLEVGSWEPVPAQTDRRQGEPPGNFERWSLLDEMDGETAAANRERLERTVAELAPFDDLVARRLVSAPLSSGLLPPFSFVASRELHYSPINADHFVCYQLRGQQTSVWCVAASVQMLLDFYRYDYDQTRVAAQLGLGTLTEPNGLPYSRDGDVVTALETLTGSALTAAMITPGNFELFVAEIDANRPMISFIPGHSRTVAGYVEVRIPIFGLDFEGLLVYDPWPPNTGVITRWENYNAISHRQAFKAAVSLH